MVFGSKLVGMCTRVTSPGHVLLIEPFNGGSHKQLVDLLCKDVLGIVPVTLPGKKWHWKARISALNMSQMIPKSDNYRVLFASSVLNLCELVSLRPDLSPLKKVLYFHENQLLYPKQKETDRDYQYGYNNITSCMVADIVLFNSAYNMESFLKTIDTFLNRIPYEKPKGVSDQIRRKCSVLNFPIVFPNIDDIKQSLEKVDHGYSMTTSTRNTNIKDNCIKTEHLCSLTTGNCHDLLTHGNDVDCDVDIDPADTTSHLPGDNNSRLASLDSKEGSTEYICPEGNTAGGTTGNQSTTGETQPEHYHPDKKRKPLSIVWPHRWEHDKNPAMMFSVMNRLQDVGCDFRLSVLGESYTEYPDVFVENRLKLADKIENWGFVESKLKYYQILHEADCVISTAYHEFFGVAMLEAVHLGCFPLCPNRLVYPEIFPKECLYNTETQLYKRLREFCRKPYLLRQNTFKFNTEQYSWDTLKPQFMKYLTVEEIS